MHAHEIHDGSNNAPEYKKQVLTKALIKVNDQLNLSRQELSAILGISESSLSRLFSKRLFIDPPSNEGQLAILLIRLYQSIDILFGGNSKQCQLWLRSENSHLREKPILLIQSISGLSLVVRYLDAMRGKI